MSEAQPIGLVFDRHTVVNNIVTLFTGSVAAQAMSTVALLLMARQLGPEQYGQYAGVTVLATFAGIIFNLGLDLWLLQRGGREPARIGEISGSLLAIKLGLGAIWLVGMLALAGWIETPSLPIGLIRLSALMIWINSLFATILTTFKSILQNSVSSLLEVLSAVVRLLGTLVLVSLGTQQASTFVWMQVGVLAFFLLIALIVALRRLELSSRWEIAVEALRQSLPYASSDLLAMLFMRQDILIIALMLGDTAAGIYSPAVGVLNAAFLAPAAVHLVMLPVLSNLFASHPQQARLTTRRAMAVFTVVGIALMIGLYLGAPILTWMLGARFAGSENILQILSPIIFSHSINYGLAAVLVATNMQKRRSVVQAVTVVLNLALNLLVVRRFGIPGVAGVYVVTEIALVAGYGWLIWKYVWRDHNFAPIVGRPVT